MRKCKVCDKVIPEGRIKILPHTQTCVDHSTEKPFGVNTVQVGDLEDDGYQETEIIRDPKVIEELNYYKKQQGKYNQQ